MELRTENNINTLFGSMRTNFDSDKNRREEKIVFLNLNLYKIFTFKQ